MGMEVMQLQSFGIYSCGVLGVTVALQGDSRDVCGGAPTALHIWMTHVSRMLILLHYQPFYSLSPATP